MSTRFVIIGALMGFLAVAAGAFGAHGLRETLSEQDLTIYQTAVTYQMYHALALILYGLLARGWQDAPSWPGLALLAGIVIFSGSLYLLVFTGVRKWGMVTPIGGLAFLIGWAGIAYAAWQAARSTG